MAKWNPLALKLLMWVMGVLLVMGSGLGFIGTSFFPFDTWAGVTASVAGVAFGAGVMIAGFNPEANVSWVRALVLYAILQVVYEGLREDKPAADVRRAVPDPKPAEFKRPAAQAKRSRPS